MFAAQPPRWAALFVLALLIALSGCAVQTRALREHPPAGLARSVELTETPFIAQTEYQCGPAALATVLGAAGLPADAQALGEQVFLRFRDTGTGLEDVWTSGPDGVTAPGTGRPVSP